MKIHLIFGNEGNKEINAQEIADHYADTVCARYDWGKKSPAWYELSRLEGFSDESLKGLTLQKYPDADITGVEIIRT